MKNFRTLNKRVQTEIIEKKSRFIGNALSISSEDEAINFISQIKKKYYDARHNCFAYVINKDIPIIKFSDDGEPNGTAGKPILDVLLGEKLKNVVIVVTRYFGGILLGTGGLVRAYQKATKECISLAQIIDINTYIKIFITLDYSLLGKVQYEISNNNCIIINTNYTDLVKISIYVKTENLENFIKNIICLTNNKIKIEKEKEYFLKVINGQVIEN